MEKGLEQTDEQMEEGGEQMDIWKGEEKTEVVERGPEKMKMQERTPIKEDGNVRKRHTRMGEKRVEEQVRKRQTRMGEMGEVRSKRNRQQDSRTECVREKNLQPPPARLAGPCRWS